VTNSAIVDERDGGRFGEVGVRRPGHPPVLGQEQLSGLHGWVIHASGLVVMSEQRPPMDGDNLKCSFCDKRQDQVEVLIARPGGHGWKGSLHPATPEPRAAATWLLSADANGCG